MTTGESSSPLPAAHRLIYIRYGSVIANGATLTQDQFAYHDDPLSLQGEAEMSKIGAGGCRRPTKHRNYFREPKR